MEFVHFAGLHPTMPLREDHTKLMEALTEENRTIKQRLKQAELEAKQLAHQLQMLKCEVDSLNDRLEAMEHPDQVFGVTTVRISYFLTCFADDVGTLRRRRSSESF